MGEPAAVLYRLGSIINHWNSSKKKSRDFCATILPRGLQPKRKKRRLRCEIVGLFCGSDATKRCKNAAEASEASERVRARIPLSATQHGRPRIAAVCDACRRRKRSAAFERKGRLAAAAADAADGIGHAARSTRRAVCARRGARAAAACEQPGLAATVRRARGSERAVWRRESTPQRGPPSLRGGRRPFRQQVVQLTGWQRDMPSGGSSIIRRCTAGTS